MKTATIGLEVVRSKGDYVVGRIGIIIAVDNEKKRAQVDWKGEAKTWVSYESLEPTSIPYEIIDGYFDKEKKRFVYPKYRSKPSESIQTHKVIYNGKECEAINFGSL